MTAGALDARGCLTPAGLAALAEAPPGRAPQELAAHLASCAACQDRMLARMRAPGARRATRPPLWRTAIVVLALIVMLLMALSLASRFSAG